MTVLIKTPVNFHCSFSCYVHFYPSISELTCIFITSIFIIFFLLLPPLIKQQQTSACIVSQICRCAKTKPQDVVFFSQSRDISVHKSQVSCQKDEASLLILRSKIKNNTQKRVVCHLITVIKCYFLFQRCS